MYKRLRYCQNWSHKNPLKILSHFQYIEDLDCPVNPEMKEQVIDWLLGYAVHLEYSDKGKIIFKVRNQRNADVQQLYKSHGEKAV
jgi:hypothetical protein